jgi:NhaP-type Na+/H+ or K+/H+ antiporter
MLDSLLFLLMLTITLGIASQWVAWRYRFPAIVLMSLVGLLVGPILGILNPKDDFGDMFNPVISIAVAIILFEGSLNLDFREVRGLRHSVLRIVTGGAFIAWILGSLAAHYVAGLSWAVAFVIGGLFIVTGPTVILPLLRQAKLKSRPATILKWEGIIVDPIGALLAVFAFEIIKFFSDEAVTATILFQFFLGSLFAALFGWLCAKLVGWMFEKGYVAEFLKSPMVFTVVIACFSISDEIVHETGLLAVTVMGVVLANMHISSIDDMRNFKENISVLLISTIFIMLTASFTLETLLDILNWNIIIFVVLMLFIVRPISIGLSTIGTELTLKEKILVGWIAPRGIVALTVSGYFASVLLTQGFEDANLLIPLTFALVFATVVVHGFSIVPLAKKLDLAVEGKPGIMIVGGSSFSSALAKSFEELNISTLIADSSWARLITARKAGVSSYHGEILSGHTEYHLDFTPYEQLIATTEIDSYNALVCTNFVPEFGRNNMYQLCLHNDHIDDLEDLVHTIGGKILFRKGATWEELNKRVECGQVIRKTKLTEKYNYKQYLDERDEDTILLYIVKSGKVHFYTQETQINPEMGDLVVSLGRPNNGREKAKNIVGSKL